MTQTGIGRLALALGRAILSLGFWMLVFFCFYGAIAGDRRSDLPPLTLWQTYAAPVGIVAVALFIHAALNLAWASRYKTGAK